MSRILVKRYIAIALLSSSVAVNAASSPTPSAGNESISLSLKPHRGNNGVHNRKQAMTTTQSPPGNTPRSTEDYRFAIKTNLLQGAVAFAPNVGVEYLVNRKTTI